MPESPDLQLLGQPIDPMMVEVNEFGHTHWGSKTWVENNQQLEESLAAAKRMIEELCGNDKDQYLSKIDALEKREFFSDVEFEKFKKEFRKKDFECEFNEGTTGTCVSHAFGLAIKNCLKDEFKLDCCLETLITALVNLIQPDLIPLHPLVLNDLHVNLKVWDLGINHVYIRYT